MSRKLKQTLAALAIIMAITAYLGYKALIGIADALEGQDVWIDE